MSQVYSTEPQTSGSIVFETTHGPLSIHLWCKECPHTVRFFLQLCIDGYYDNLVFHRIVPNFLIQIGDSRFRQGFDKKPPPLKYRQQHKASEALDRRPYEVNSRIRFNHRGQIAMALGIEDGDSENDQRVQLQPQFFITLDEASHLDGKHVCFGGITGPTIFNALRIGQTDVLQDEKDPNNFQPRIVSEAPKILRTKILQIDLPLTLPALAPTPDPSLLPWKISDSKALIPKEKRKKKNRKGVKNTNLLSFGEEMEESETAVPQKKIQSSHDVLVSRSLSAKATTILRENTIIASPMVPKDSDPKEPDIISSNRETPVTKATFVPREPPTTKENREGPVTKASTAPRKQAEKIVHSKKPKAKKISLLEARKAKYANQQNRSTSKQAREEKTMARFKAFQEKFSKAAKASNGKGKSEVYHGQILEDHGSSGDWMQTTFKCKKHMDQDAKGMGGDGRGVHDYEVIQEKNAPTDRKQRKY